MSSAGAKTVLSAFVLALLLLPSRASVSAADGERSDARILSSEEAVEVRKDGTATHSIKRRIKVFGEQGVRYGAVYLTETMFSEPSEVKGFIYDSADKLILKRGKGDLQKFCGFGEYQLYSDICDHYLNLAAGNYPFTVEYEVVEEISSLVSWPGWYPQWFVPVDYTSYSLTVPEGFAYRTAATGTIGSPIESVDDGKRTLKWEMRELPAFEDEPYMPPVKMFTPTLEFVVDRYKYGDFEIDCSSWEAASRSTLGLMSSAFKLSKAQLAVLDSIMYASPSSAVGCSRLHGFLAGRSRYVAISIGVGGWQPHAAEVTFAHRYGDCKDLTTMYVAMLAQAGIEAHPALVLTRDEGRTDPEFPRLSFNHEILYYVLNGDTTWIDPTCFTCELNDLPASDEGISVLALDPAEGKMLKTPVSTAEDNMMVRKATIMINDDLSAAVTIDLHAVGEPGNSLRHAAQMLQTVDLGERLKGYWGAVGPVLQIKECKAAIAETGLSEIRMRVKGNIQRFTRQVKDRLYFDLSVLPTTVEAEQVNLSGRKYPIEFECAYAFVDSIFVHLPNGYQFSQMPKDTSVSDQFGELRLQFTADSGQATITRYKALTVREIDTTALRQYGEHCLTQRKIVGQSLAIEKR